MDPFVRGSEEIYESIITPSQSSIDPIRDDRVEDGENIITTPNNPDKAFELFQGKFFNILCNKEKEQLIEESAADKLSRIQYELQQLSTSFTQVASSSSSSNSLVSDLQSRADSLSRTAFDLSAHPLMTDPYSSSHSQSINKKLKEISASIVSASSTQPPTNFSSTPRIPLIEESSIEHRLSLLESILGSASNALDVEAVHGISPRIRVFPLADTISKIEQRLLLLDEQNMEGLKSRAKTLRIELEAINKLSLSSSNAVDQKLAAEVSWKKVSDLSDKLRRLETTADDLPVIATRLKTLQSMHQAAGAFSQRVVDLQTAADNTSKQLQANKDVLEAMQKSLSESAAAMIENAALVDSRIAAILKMKR